ncbi:protein-disulfide reductase DsbD family protein [Melioribacter sp. Ez-97]|uniref:protein-disulfide reductase DsbD family protein n=1 Tax=Melioribacter sp. Ez-97 TaxID=3423434 RepID=UPI003ED9CCE9
MKFKLFTLLFIPFFVFAQFGLQKNILKMELVEGQDVASPNSNYKFAVKLNISEEWHINSNNPNEDFLIPTRILSEDPRFQFAKIVYPEAKELKFEFSDKPVSVFDGTIYIGALLRIDAALEEGDYRIPIKITYQACNNQSCLPPSSLTDTLLVKVVKENAPAAELNSEIFKNIDFGKTSIEENNDNTIASTLESSGLLLSLLFVFLGGLALNLTPCVYPLIPITVGYFGGQSEGRTGRLFLLGSLYVLGMALTYSVIGVVTALSGAVFGSLLQNTIVIIVIALLFVILSLSQFGVYEFKLPDSWVMKAGGAKSGYFGAFFMGLTMGIVAAPCIGPFVLGLVTYVAAKGDPVYGFWLFFVMALGLGLPYLFLALFSGKIKSLPRAGDWMEGVKHVFGFLLLGMAVYFVAPLFPKEINLYFLPVFGIVAALILLVFDKTANNIKGFRIFKTIFSIVVLALSVYSLLPADKPELPWEKFSEEKYQASLDNGEKMIIDFYADWCIPCKELEAITFADAKVAEKMKEFKLFKVDMTQTISEETEKLRNKFNIVGMPTVLIIDSSGREVKRLTGFVQPEEFFEIINAVE